MIYFRSLGVSTCCIALHAARVKHSHDLHTDFKIQENKFMMMIMMMMMITGFCRAMLRRVQLLYCMSSVCPSVRSSVRNI